MPYPPDMQESLARVEATRSARLQETFPSLTPQEKRDLLKRFHPDYIESAMREVRVGPNRGGRTPLELAALLEAPSRLQGVRLDLSRVDYEVDVLVIGGGGAGCAAAILADDHGARVLLATKLRLGDANTMMAQGGIQAADKANDSPALHYLDVMGGGGYVNDPDLVEALVRDAPLVIQWLENLGTMFDKDPDGTMRTIHGGGTCRRRMHSARDYTGAEIMRTLRDEVRSRPQVRLLEFSPAVELLTGQGGEVTGAVLQNLETGEYLVVRARAVVVATGGSGRLHYQGFATTNHYGATGDGLVLAYRVGAKLSFIDTMQYHPTGAAFPEQILGLLVTEKVRGLGAQVLNVEGKQFVFPRETRDAEAAAIIREVQERRLGVRAPSGMEGVWLDSPMIELIHGPGTVQRELPAMVRQFARFDVDIVREPMLVYPTLHYQNGGVAIRPDGSTEVPNLFVAGEAAGGIHGRNRLMGNSLLDVTVFGRRAGRAAAERAKQVEPGTLTLAHVEAWEKARREAGLEEAEPSPLVLPKYTRHERE
jgi:succinate dehydrogenase/fumarate reductase flavoprotein subunit